MAELQNAPPRSSRVDIAEDAFPSRSVEEARRARSIREACHLDEAPTDRKTRGSFETPNRVQLGARELLVRVTLESWLEKIANRGRELGVARLVACDGRVRAAHLGVRRMRRLPRRDERTERLSHAALDGVFEREVLDRARAGATDLRSHDSPAEASSEPSHDLRMPPFVAGGAPRFADEPRRRAERAKLGGQARERNDGCALQVRRAGEVISERARAARRRITKTIGTPAGRGAARAEEERGGGGGGGGPGGIAD